MDGREITVPTEPVTIPSSACFIWPVALPMEDATLLYATAQPFCVLKNGAEKTYVFAQTITDRRTGAESAQIRARRDGTPGCKRLRFVFDDDSSNLSLPTIRDSITIVNCSNSLIENQTRVSSGYHHRRL